MANHEILLLKPVDGLGAEGDQVKVRAGYARNFLLPRKLAAEATPDMLNAIKIKEKAKAVQAKQQEPEGNFENAEIGDAPGAKKRRRRRRKPGGAEGGPSNDGQGSSQD